MWANYVEYLDRNRYRTITVSSADVLVVVFKRLSVFIFSLCSQHSLEDRMSHFTSTCVVSLNMNVAGAVIVGAGNILI